MPFAPSPTEVAIVNQIFVQADPQKLGLVTGEQGIRVFAGAKLPPATLGDIWAIADPENNGALTRKGVAIAVRLIGWAQNGETPSSELLEKVGPLPAIDGLALPAVSSLASRAPAPIVTQPFSLPPLVPTDRAKFLGLFNKTNPNGGLLSGDQARNMFLRSKLPLERLNVIWNLVDTQNRGSLDSAQFILAMYFIQGSMTANPTIPVLPLSIPPFLWDQAGGKPPSVHSHNSGGTSPTSQSPYTSKPFTPPYTGGSMSALQQQTTGDPQIRSQFTGTHVVPQMTGNRAVPAIPSRPSNFAMAPQLTGTPFPLARQGTSPSLPWDVTAEEKANSDGFFDTLDAARLGFVEGGAAVPFMLLSGLPEDILARIWDLADMRNDGRLTKDTFAVAMHLINSVLEGKDLPAVLPITLVPPSLRGSAGFAPFPVAAPTVSEAQRDLLSLDDDLSVLSPPQPASPPRIVSPPAPVPVISQIAASVLNPVAQTPPVVSAPSRGRFERDLLDDEEAEERQTIKLSDNNVEIANIRNQLSSTTNAQEAAQNERVKLEADLATSAATLSQLQTQLASAKVGYDSETKLLAGLRERYQAQAVEIQSTRDELIRAESDLSALKQEKTEVGGNLLREKDDVRDLKRRVAEVTEEISSIKKEIEQAKKETRLQKGLLAIARKQLSTAESDKEAAEKELGDAKEEAEKAEVEVAQTEAAVATLKRSLSNASTSSRANGSAMAGSMSPQMAASTTSPSVATPALPFTDVSNAASPSPSVKSNNPFDRLRQSSVSDASTPQRTASPFTTPNFSAEPTTLESANEDDPFGFNETLSSPQIPVASAESTVPGTETPRQQSSGVNNDVSEKLPSSPDHNRLITPSDTFFTPPSSSVSNPGIFAGEQASTASRFPPLDEEPTQSPKIDSDIPPLMDIVEKAEESSSESDDDDRPLGEVKAEKLAAGSDQVARPTTAEPSLDDLFGIPATSKTASTITNTAPSSHFSTMGSERVLSSPAVSTVPSSFAPAVNGHNTGTSPINAFDEALGLTPPTTSAAPATQTFTFDQFEDTFDFNQTSFSHEKTNSMESAIPSIAAPAVSPTLDDGFGFPATSPGAATKSTAVPLSFDDAFEVSTNGENATPNQTHTSPAPEPAHAPIDTAPVHPASNGVAATGSSVRSISPTAVRGSSSSARNTSPPPRTSSPKLPPASPRPRPAKEATSPRPGSSLSPDAAGPSRSSRLSIHFPFGRSKSSKEKKEKEKKEKSAKDHGHDTTGGVMPPVPTIPEDYSNDRYEVPDLGTPEQDGDIPPLKQLMELGFPREKAVNALENSNYNFQRALNKLLAAA